jgi:hypothetical protein
MRTPLLVAVLAAAVCLPVSAQDTRNMKFEEPAQLSLRPDPTQLFREATAPRAAVSTESPDSAFIFAVVGNAPGAGGTYFRSEVTLVNNLSRSQNVAILYFPAGGGSCNGASIQSLRLSGNTFYVWSNFVADIFNTTGLGSVVVLAVDANGNFDSTGNLDGFSRIWTPIAGFQGTASQSFPSVSLSAFPQTQFIYGLRHDSSFRTNLFIFNYLPTGSTASRVFTANVIGLSDNASFTMSVPPCSLAVSALPARTFGALSMSVTPPDSAGGWFAFGSTVDNQSGDNWSVAARPASR